MARAHFVPSCAASTVISALLACACGTAEAPADAASARPAERACAPQTAASGRVISTVDGAPITVEEVQEIVRETGLTPIEALRRLQDERVLSAHAEAAGLDDAPEVEDAARRASVQALLERRVEAEITPASISAEAVQSRIAAAPQRFARPERRRSTHVLAQLDEDATPEAHAAAERFARRAIERLQAASDPVAEAHAMESEDREGRSFRVRVEDLPPVEATGQLVPEYLAALFAQHEPGVVPEPVRTRFGYHAIVRSEIVPPWQAPPSEIDTFVRDELMIEARARRLEELLATLAERTPIELDEAAITRAMAQDLAPPPEDAP